MTDTSRFQAWLADIMRSRRITARTIAAYAGVAPSTVTNWSRGAMPKPEHLQKLAAALHIEYRTLALLVGYVVEGDAPGQMPGDGKVYIPVEPEQSEAFNALRSAPARLLNHFAQIWLDLHTAETPNRYPQGEESGAAG